MTLLMMKLWITKIITNEIYQMFLKTKLSSKDEWLIRQKCQLSYILNFFQWGQTHVWIFWSSNKIYMNILFKIR